MAGGKVGSLPQTSLLQSRMITCRAAHRSILAEPAYTLQTFCRFAGCDGAAGLTTMKWFSLPERVAGGRRCAPALAVTIQEYQTRAMEMQLGPVP